MAGPTSHRSLGCLGLVALELTLWMPSGAGRVETTRTAGPSHKHVLCHEVIAPEALLETLGSGSSDCGCFGHQITPILGGLYLKTDFCEGQQIVVPYILIVSSQNYMLKWPAS